MRVFVTGASGWIGSAVVPDLVAAGHRVTGLARSDASAIAIEAAGATVVRGTIDDLEVLRDAAATADAVVHLAFRHDIGFSGRLAEALASDRAAIETMGAALPDGGALAIASGVLGISDGRLATETDRPEPGEGFAARHASAEAALALAPRLRSSVVRLSPTVHGDGDGGFVPTLIAIARQQGVAGYPGAGSARWPAVHVSDAARLFRLAIEVAPPGSVLHGVADEGVPVHEIAGVIGRQLDVPARSVPDDQVAEHFGFLGVVLGMDSPASNAITREVTGWAPEGPGLLEDLEKGHYFAPSAGSKYV